MPKAATVLRVFVASPSDVSEERQRLNEVVSAVNSGFATTGVRLELIRWEQDASPSLGEDAQSVINEQLLTDYDIFVGIMWNTVGSPTGRAESGTIEEFENALRRFQEDAAEPKVMMYFKDSVPLSMDEIDPNQLTRVREFRSRVKDLGLYHTFNSPRDFAAAVQVHLTKLMVERLPKDDGRQHPPSEANVQGESTDIEDQGLMELEETILAEMFALTGVVNRMGDATREIGLRLHHRTAALGLLQAKAAKSSSHQSLRADMKRQFGRTARNMDQFVGSMQKELPLYRQHLYRGIGAIAKAVPLSLHFGEDKGELPSQARSLLRTMDTFLRTMEDFKTAVNELPPVTSPMLRAKRATDNVLQQIIDVSNGGKTLLLDVMPLLD